MELELLYQSQSLDSFSSSNLSESVTNWLVLGWVDLKDYNLLRGMNLHSALDDIKRADESVSQTASHDASKHALGIVTRIVFITTHVSDFLF
jgi:hypothetical protein